MNVVDQTKSLPDGKRSLVSESANKWLGIFTGLIALLYLIHVFIPDIWIYRTYSILSLILLCFGMLTVRRGNQLTVLTLLVVGFVILGMNKVDFWYIAEGFGKNVNLITLFFVVPLIGVIISIGGYLTALKYKLKEIQKGKEGHPYRWSTMLTSSMGLLLNLGSMPIIYRIAEESFPPFYKKKMGVVLSRAFAFCMLWSPYFVNVGLILVLFHLSWTDIGWIGFIIACAYGAIATLFFKSLHFKDDILTEPFNKQELKEIEKSKIAQEQDEDRKQGQLHSQKINKKMLSLGLWSTLLILLSFFFDFVSDLSMLTIVSMMALIYPFIWSVTIGVLQDFVHAVVDYMGQAFMRLKNEIVLFISAGFFGVAIAYTNIGEVVSLLIYQLSFGSVYLLAVLISLFTIFLAVIGIHPVIVIIGIGSSLDPSVFGVSPVFLAVNLLLAWMLATSVSPFSGTILMASSLAGETPVAIVQKNIVFIAVCILILPLILVALYALGLV